MISISRLFELNKAESMVAAGKLSKNNIARLNNAKSIRSAEQYTSGMDRGSENIAKKKGYTTNTSKLANFLGPHANPLDNSINLPKNDTLFRTMMSIKNKSLMTKEKARALDPIVKRHEIDELETNKVSSPINFKDKEGKLVGKHNSPEVLRREQQHIDYLANAHEGAFRDWKNMRHKTGEYDMVEKMSKKDIKRYEKENEKGGNGLERIGNATSNLTDDLDKAKGIFNKFRAFKKGIKNINNVQYTIQDK